MGIQFLYIHLSSLSAHNSVQKLMKQKLFAYNKRKDKDCPHCVQNIEKHEYIPLLLYHVHSTLLWAGCLDKIQ